MDTRGKHRKKPITQQIRTSLYDGITDQVLCTKITCDGEDPNLVKGDKCVSYLSMYSAGTFCFNKGLCMI